MHYLLPAVLMGVLLVWSLRVPFNVQLELVKSGQPALTGDYVVYSWAFISKSVVRLFFTLVYGALIFVALGQYYRHFNSSSEQERKPARWIVFLIALMGAIVLASFAMIFLSRDRVFQSGLSVIAIAYIICQHILLTYHIINRKYLLYTVRVPKRKPRVSTPTVETGRRSYLGGITRESLETLFDTQKPYLNPNFKIIDLVELMDVNRSVISNFINKNLRSEF